MNEYLAFGKLTLWVNKKVTAENEQEAMMKIDSTVGHLVINLNSIEIEDVAGAKHKLEVDDFYIEWEEVVDENVPI
jgi:hypothetical protein